MTIALTLHLEFYNNFRPCILAVSSSGEPYGKLSVNLPDFDIEPNQFFAKTYSENSYWVEEVLKQYPHRFELVIDKGFHHNGIYFPLYQLTDLYIASEFEKTYNAKSDIYEASQPLWNLYEKYCAV